MTGWAAPWWIAGGYGLELALGRSWRTHGDIDALVLRPSAGELHEALAGWELWVVDPPGELRFWPADEPLPDHVHDIWCRRPSSPAWELQLMVDEAGGGEWRSRRHGRVRAPVAALGRRSADGLPYLRPEIQLFYKAKGRRPKDEIDFAVVAPTLDDAARAWLDRALAVTHPDHPWRAALRGAGPA
ncbi:amino acid transporter [Jiangella ureilytica]|uniref:Amino acid transporter n=1 Tax=Jiangella ureilytica TaxID=2530374 RepID=A0A4R4RE56_9ACTN|nr:amino acid transporter [Jiangella ureilytica]